MLRLSSSYHGNQQRLVTNQLLHYWCLSTKLSEAIKNATYILERFHEEVHITLCHVIQDWNQKFINEYLSLKIPLCAAKQTCRSTGVGQEQFADYITDYHDSTVSVPVVQMVIQPQIHHRLLPAQSAFIKMQELHVFGCRSGSEISRKFDLELRDLEIRPLRERRSAMSS